MFPGLDTDELREERGIYGSLHTPMFPRPNAKKTFNIVDPLNFLFIEYKIPVGYVNRDRDFLNSERELIEGKFPGFACTTLLRGASTDDFCFFYCCKLERKKPETQSVNQLKEEQATRGESAQ